MLVFLVLSSCKDQKNETGDSKTQVKVEIIKENDGYVLKRDGKPYFIKGARTIRTKYMDKVVEYGGNSVRIGYNENVIEVLDEAHRFNLTVLFGLPMQAERNDFDYNDQIAISEQYKGIKDIVETYKEHPSLLAWAIGNELDHIPGDKDYNLYMWNAVNDIAKMIHEVDPNHPAMTVIGMGKNEKLTDLIERCPDLDLLGVNAYADIWEVPDLLRKYNWNKPYAVTEWGPSGHWQVPRTKWGVVIEETSTEKARVYKERYEKVILDDPWCVGSYVFLWTSNRQERTHTWYNMFHDNGTEKEAVQIMQYEWTGQWPENRAPHIDSVQIDGMNALDNINVAAETLHYARVFASDPDVDKLTIEWELVPENKKFGAYAGHGETKPPPVPEVIKEIEEHGKLIQFLAPQDKGGNYRLFVYVYDGQENVAVANIPFHIKEE